MIPQTPFDVTLPTQIIPSAGIWESGSQIIAPDVPSASDYVDLSPRQISLETFSGLINMFFQSHLKNNNNNISCLITEETAVHIGWNCKCSLELSCSACYSGAEAPPVGIAEKYKR